jgi:hypothetical protein
MAASNGQIAQLRRMVQEPTEDIYSDELLASYIENYPVMDQLGQPPFTYETSATPPTEVENESWIPTYDLNQAAADIWQEKAATVADKYDFSADGGSYSRSQMVAQYNQMAASFRARRAPNSFKLVKWPDEPGNQIDVVANQPEED